MRRIQSCHFCSVHRLESAVIFQTLKQQMLLSPFTARSTILLETVAYLVQKQYLSITIALK